MPLKSTYRLQRIGKLAAQLDTEIAKALKHGDYKELPEPLAERFLVLILERRDRQQWRQVVYKFVAWFNEKFPHNGRIKRNTEASHDGIETAGVISGDRSESGGGDGHSGQASPEPTSDAEHADDKYARDCEGISDAGEESAQGHDLPVLSSIRESLSPQIK